MAPTAEKDNVVQMPAPPEPGKVVETMEELSDGSDIEYKEIPGFKRGELLRIGSLTAGDLIEWSEANEGEAKRNAGLRLIQKSIVNSKGERIASDPKFLQIFKNKNHKATEEVVKRILRFNGMKVPGEAGDPEAETKKD